ncbi:hypothetical protein GWI33_006950 [Rhynchophorus ferrugineus]|uniref:Uncharacterized protein n=1 Tax=Rhynchophorus ferrugineus TaxID=354439 RepID=A0A834MF46_RHYFE|nr:hypothetical protein GWI33_006950 [Rhynchophorus ferrugineus]
MNFVSNVFKKYIQGEPKPVDSSHVKAEEKTESTEKGDAKFNEVPDDISQNSNNGRTVFLQETTPILNFLPSSETGASPSVQFAKHKKRNSKNFDECRQSCSPESSRLSDSTSLSDSDKSVTMQHPEACAAPASVNETAEVKPSIENSAQIKSSDSQSTVDNKICFGHKSVGEKHTNNAAPYNFDIPVNLNMILQNKKGSEAEQTLVDEKIATLETKTRQGDIKSPINQSENIKGTEKEMRPGLDIPNAKYVKENTNNKKHIENTSQNKGSLKHNKPEEQLQTKCLNKVENVNNNNEIIREDVETLNDTSRGDCAIYAPPTDVRLQGCCGSNENIQKYQENLDNIVKGLGLVKTEFHITGDTTILDHSDNNQLNQRTKERVAYDNNDNKITEKYIKINNEAAVNVGGGGGFILNQGFSLKTCEINKRGDNQDMQLKETKQYVESLDTTLIAQNGNIPSTNSSNIVKEIDSYNNNFKEKEETSQSNLRECSIAVNNESISQEKTSQELQPKAEEEIIKTENNFNNNVDENQCASSKKCCTAVRENDKLVTENLCDTVLLESIQIMEEEQYNNKDQPINKNIKSSDRPIEQKVLTEIGVKTDKQQDCTNEAVIEQQVCENKVYVECKSENNASNKNTHIGSIINQNEVINEVKNREDVHKISPEISKENKTSNTINIISSNFIPVESLVNNECAEGTKEEKEIINEKNTQSDYNENMTLIQSDNTNSKNIEQKKTNNDTIHIEKDKIVDKVVCKSVVHSQGAKKEEDNKDRTNGNVEQQAFGEAKKNDNKENKNSNNSVIISTEENKTENQCEVDQFAIPCNLSSPINECIVKELIKKEVITKTLTGETLDTAKADNSGEINVEENKIHHDIIQKEKHDLMKKNVCNWIPTECNQTMKKEINIDEHKLNIDSNKGHTVQEAKSVIEIGVDSQNPHAKQIDVNKKVVKEIKYFESNNNIDIPVNNPTNNEYVTENIKKTNDILTNGNKNILLENIIGDKDCEKLSKNEEYIIKEDIAIKPADYKYLNNTSEVMNGNTPSCSRKENIAQSNKIDGDKGPNIATDIINQCSGKETVELAMVNASTNEYIKNYIEKQSEICKAKDQNNVGIEASSDNTPIKVQQCINVTGNNNNSVNNENNINQEKPVEVLKDPGEISDEQNHEIKSNVIFLKQKNSVNVRENEVEDCIDENKLKENNFMDNNTNGQMVEENIMVKKNTNLDRSAICLPVADNSLDFTENIVMNPTTTENTVCNIDIHEAKSSDRKILVGSVSRSNDNINETLTSTAITDGGQNNSTTENNKTNKVESSQTEKHLLLENKTLVMNRKTFSTVINVNKGLVANQNNFNLINPESASGNPNNQNDGLYTFMDNVQADKRACGEGTSIVNNTALMKINENLSNCHEEIEKTTPGIEENISRVNFVQIQGIDDVTKSLSDNQFVKKGAVLNNLNNESLANIKLNEGACLNTLCCDSVSMVNRNLTQEVEMETHLPQNNAVDRLLPLSREENDSNDADITCEVNQEALIDKVVTRYPANRVNFNESSIIIRDFDETDTVQGGNDADNGCDVTYEENAMVYLLEGTAEKNERPNQVKYQSGCDSNSTQVVEKYRAEKEVTKEKQNLDSDLAKLESTLKRMKIKVLSLENSLKQKTQECQALSAFWEDMTSPRR